MNTLSDPSLSVLLPCHNEAAPERLPAQLAAVLPQLLPSDEIVLLDDGSTDRTWSLMTQVRSKAHALIIGREKPGGVNTAFDLAASHATKEWVLGAAGNDQIQPGAIAAWRAAAAECPQAQICFGQIWQGPRLNWFPTTTFVPPELVVELWRRHRRQDTHGAACFIRRTSWGSGYSAGEWMADWWQAWKITARHGCLFLPYVISKLGNFPGYSSKHYYDDEGYNKAILQIRAEAEGAECADIRQQVLAYQAICGFLDLRAPWIKFERGSKRLAKR